MASKLEIEDLTQDTPHYTKIYTTSVFVPMEMRLSNKTFSYLTGLIRLVETFKKQTHWEDKGENDKKYNWALYIFVDKALIHDEFDNKIYENNNKNNQINKAIKEEYKSNKDIIDKLYKLYKLYIGKLLEDREKYKFVKIFTFIDNGLYDKLDKQYYGHVSTYGSFIRFLPFFNDNIHTEDQLKENSKLVESFKMCRQIISINASHPVTDLMECIKQNWIKSTKKIMIYDAFGAYSFCGERNIRNYESIYDLLRGKPTGDKNIGVEVTTGHRMTKVVPNCDYRIPAGFFGYNKDGIWNSSDGMFGSLSERLTSGYAKSFIFKTQHAKDFEEKYIDESDTKITYRAFQEMISKLINFMDDRSIYDLMRNFAYMIDEIILMLMFDFHFYPNPRNYYSYRSMFDDIINFDELKKKSIAELNETIKNNPIKQIDINNDNINFKDGLYNINIDNGNFTTDGDTEIKTKMISDIESIKVSLREQIKKNKNGISDSDVEYQIGRYIRLGELMISGNLKNKDETLNKNIIQFLKKLKLSFEFNYIEFSMDRLRIQQQYLSPLFIKNTTPKAKSELLKILQYNKCPSAAVDPLAILFQIYNESKPLMLYSNNFPDNSHVFDVYFTFANIDDYTLDSMGTLLNNMIGHFSNIVGDVIKYKRGYLSGGNKSKKKYTKIKGKRKSKTMTKKKGKKTYRSKKNQKH